MPKVDKLDPKNFKNIDKIIELSQGVKQKAIKIEHLDKWQLRFPMCKKFISQSTASSTTIYATITNTTNTIMINSFPNNKLTLSLQSHQAPFYKEALHHLLNNYCYQHVEYQSAFCFRKSTMTIKKCHLLLNYYVIYYHITYLLNIF